MSRSRKARAGSHPEQLLLHLRRVHAGEHRKGNSSARIRSANRTGSSGAVASWVISARSRLAAGESSATFSILAAFVPAAPRPWGPTSGSSARSVRALLRGPQACAFTCTFARTPPQAAEQTAQLA